MAVHGEMSLLVSNNEKSITGSYDVLCAEDIVDMRIQAITANGKVHNLDFLDIVVIKWLKGFKD